MHVNSTKYNAENTLDSISTMKQYVSVYTAVKWSETLVQLQDWSHVSDQANLVLVMSAACSLGLCIVSSSLVFQVVQI